MGLAYTRCSHPLQQTAARRPPVVPRTLLQGPGRSTRTPASSATARTCRVCIDRGPSLVGVGQAATYFQVSTGRMPAVANQRAEPAQAFLFTTTTQINQLERLHRIKRRWPGRSRTVASCRMSLTCRQGRRVVPAELRLVPQLHRSGWRVVPGQVRPEPGPGHRSARSTQRCCPARRTCRSSRTAQLTPTREEVAIITFVQDNKATIDPGGGYALGGFGPAPEGLVAFLVGMGAIVALTLWMGARA